MDEVIFDTVQENAGSYIAHKQQAPYSRSKIAIYVAGLDNPIP